MNEENIRKNLVCLWALEDNLQKVFAELEGCWKEPAMGGYYQIWLTKEVYYKIIRSMINEVDNSFEVKFLKYQLYTLLCLLPMVKKELADECEEKDVLAYIDSRAKDDDKEDWIQMHKIAKSILLGADETIIYYLRDFFLRF